MMATRSLIPFTLSRASFLQTAADDLQRSGRAFREKRQFPFVTLPAGARPAIELSLFDEGEDIADRIDISLLCEQCGGQAECMGLCLRAPQDVGSGPGNMAEEFRRRA